MNIGLMGGTFDPIHKGHLRIAESAADEYKLDELWFIPAGDPYFKSDKKVTPSDIRLKMTKLCIADTGKNYKVSDIEIKRTGNTYTSDTLSLLKKERPTDTFFFIIGQDSLFQLDRWHKPEVLFDSAIILCALRDNTDAAPAKLKIKELKDSFTDSVCDIRLIHCALIDVSSTKIRKAVSDGEDISDYVTPSVKKYIYSNNLYR